MVNLSATKEQMTYFEMALVAAALLLLGSLLLTFSIEIVNITALIKTLAVAAVSLMLFLFAVIVISFCVGFMILNWSQIYKPKERERLPSLDGRIE